MTIINRWKKPIVQLLFQNPERIQRLLYGALAGRAVGERDVETPTEENIGVGIRREQQSEPDLSWRSPLLPYVAERYSVVPPRDSSSFSGRGIDAMAAENVVTHGRHHCLDEAIDGNRFVAGGIHIPILPQNA